MRHIFRNFASPVLTAVLLFAAFAPLSLRPLVWIGLVPLFLAARGKSPGTQARHFFVSGFVFHVLVLQWLIANIMWAGGWAVVGQLALCAVLASFWAALGYLHARLQTRFSPAMAAIFAAVLWVAMEQSQGTVFSGLGWSSLGYSQGSFNSLGVSQLAVLIGGVGLSGVFVLVNALLVESITQGPGHRRYAGAAVSIIVAASVGGWLLGDVALGRSSSLRVGVLQPYFPLEMKWDPEYTGEMVRNAAQKSTALAEHEPVDLFVWPEATIMADIDSIVVREHLDPMLRQTQAYLFAGSHRSEEGKSFNSSYLLNPNGSIGARYDKIHLAPFGEYVPFSQYFPFIQKIVPSIGSISPGAEPVVFEVNGRSFGPLICFEVIFPAMAHRLRAEGADALIVITNLAWWGRSNAIPQELEIARMRAIETRLPVIHASNSGISGVFDPYGNFQPVNRYIDAAGRLYRTREGVSNAELIMQRLAGSFLLPNAAPHPAPWAPHYLPWAAVALSGIIALAAFAPKPEPPRT